MPNRIIRESCRTSPTLAKLSHGAERLFWRLTTVADDFGRFEADPMVMMAQCFPNMLHSVKLGDVEDWIAEVIRCDLLRTYVSNGKTLGFFVTWDKHQIKRARASKYPEPCPDNICSHPLANVSEKREARSESSDVPRSEKREARSETATIPPAVAVVATRAAWEGYSTAYQHRYGVTPVRNQKVNSQLVQLVKRIGEAEAGEVAAFYVGHNAAFYVRVGHSVDCLLKDAEKLRTEWATGRKITETGARQSDETAERGGIAQRLLAKAARQRQEAQDAQ